MGMFDFFSREGKVKEDRRAKSSFDEPTIKAMSSSGPVSVYSPTAYSDVEAIINVLKSGKTAIVHLTDLKTETAIRVLDMLSGAIYALNGGVYEMQKNIFMFSPSGVEVY